MRLMETQQICQRMEGVQEISRSHMRRRVEIPLTCTRRRFYKIEDTNSPQDALRKRRHSVAATSPQQCQQAQIQWISKPVSHASATTHNNEKNCNHWIPKPVILTSDQYRRVECRVVSRKHSLLPSDTAEYNASLRQSKPASNKPGHFMTIQAPAPRSSTTMLPSRHQLSHPLPLFLVETNHSNSCLHKMWTGFCTHAALKWMNHATSTAFAAPSSPSSFQERRCDLNSIRRTTKRASMDCQTSQCTHDFGDTSFYTTECWL